MKLSAIALKNLKRNFSFYSLYLFSVSFVLMIYFCFTSFSMNQIIMEKISSDGRVETMCRTVAVFIMAFVIFYMFYSNSFFMRRRMRELGIYSLLGYRKSTILKLLIFENVMICFGGMILGILTGSILHKIGRRRRETSGKSICLHGYSLYFYCRCIGSTLYLYQQCIGSIRSHVAFRLIDHCLIQLLLFSSQKRKFPQTIHGNGRFEFQRCRSKFPDRLCAERVYRDRCIDHDPV